MIKTVFIPRSWMFWTYCVVSWLLYMLFFPFSSSGTELGSSIVWDWLRWGMMLPFLLVYRYLYNNNKWHTLQPIEMISLTLGFNLLSAIVVMFFVPFTIAHSDIWFDLFQRELIGTSRSVDEKVVSFLCSYFYQVGWCCFYMVFNSYRVHSDLETKEQAMSHELKGAKIHLLSSQISPHFLFNGLNNLCSLIDEDSVRAQSVLRSFSELLRYCLEVHKHEKISLKKEVDFVNHYIAMAKMQYEERLNFTQSIPAELARCLVPPLMIQLLIENAIKYGVGRNKDITDVSLKVTREQYYIAIEVSNDGQLYNAQEESREREKVGLNNIEQRLQLLYGEQATFSLRQIEEKVVARLLLPKLM